jgi:hypothetical protein
MIFALRYIRTRSMASSVWEAIMRNDLRVAISFTLVLAVLLTSSCTASFQIGGKQNTSEQNRQAPVSNRSEQSPPPLATPQTTPDPQANEDAKAQRQNDEQQLEDQRKAVEEERSRLEDERQAQEGARQRLKEEANRLEQQRVAQQIYILQQQQQAEEQKLVELSNRRKSEEQRLSEVQQRPQNQLTNADWPLQPQLVTRNQASVSNRVAYPYESLNPEKKKGHSTRNKIIAGGIFAGAVLLGVHLSKKKH